MDVSAQGYILTALYCKVSGTDPELNQLGWLADFSFVYIILSEASKYDIGGI